MTNVQKNEIKQAILKEAERLGSANKVAIKCEVSPATISQIKKDNWELIRVELWQHIASKLNVRFSGWQIAETTNYKMVCQILQDARSEKLFVPISEKAGAGKTVAACAFESFHNDDSVYLLRCDEWARREFLTELCSCLGIEVQNNYISIYKLGQKVIRFFEERAHTSPLLILDQSNDLKASALRFVIPFFNRLEDKVGLAVLGTENLEKEIKKGVRLQRKGYDEIDSRFGRNYIKLPGATKNDVAKIAIANGIEDKAIHISIFNECKPINKILTVGEKKVNVKVIEDVRRVRRAINRELLNSKNLNYVEA